MMGYFGSDVRRINHALKVYGFASAIGRNENLDAQTIQIIEIAAILHDIGIPEAERKYSSCAGKYQEIEGPPIARAMLESIEIAPALIDRVCYLIGNHHSYSKIDGVDFQILVEADFLVNIFEENMDAKAIHNIRKKYIKTRHGIFIFDTLYPEN